jgi:hypothetical protein
MAYLPPLLPIADGVIFPGKMYLPYDLSHSTKNDVYRYVLVETETREEIEGISNT